MDKKFLKWAKDKFDSECNYNLFLDYYSNIDKIKNRRKKYKRLQQLCKAQLDNVDPDLFELLSVFTNYNIAKKIISTEKDLGDIELYEKIKPKNKFIYTDYYDYASKNIKKQEYCGKWYSRLDFLKNNISFDINKDCVYADIGCGDMFKTEIFKKIFKLKNVYACDVEGWGHYTERKEVKGIDFDLIEDGVLPYKNRSLDLVTVMLTFHHIENIPFFLQEVNRVLKKGGKMIIIDHNVFTEKSYLILQLEHLYHSLSTHGKIDQYERYYSKPELRYLCENEGFEYIESKYLLSFDHKISYDKMYYIVFSKL